MSAPFGQTIVAPGQRAFVGRARILPQWLEHRFPELILQVESARGPVVEAEPQDEIFERRYRGDTGRSGSGA